MVNNKIILKPTKLNQEEMETKVAWMELVLNGKKRNNYFIDFQFTALTFWKNLSLYTYIYEE